MHALSCGARRGARACYRACMRWEGCSDWAERHTSQSVGSVPVVSWRRLAQRDTTACLAPGASFSSLHEWLRKAVTSPIAAGSVRSWSVGPTGGAVVMLSARSAASNRLAGRQRRRFEARSSAASGSLPPTSAATAAASSASVPRPPRRPRRRWMRPRLRGVARAANKRELALKTAYTRLYSDQLPETRTMAVMLSPA
eukprot:scaffold56194_cov73-Phaeocystis_antarctica.AAC.3